MAMEKTPVPLMRRPLFLFAPLLAACAGLGGCGGSAPDTPVVVSVIGSPEDMAAPFTHEDRLAAQARLAATAQGLVSYDAAGEIVPGLAQRWIVVDDGKSYIFRLRRARWANGERVTAQQVRQRLERRLRVLRRLDPYGALSSVSEVLAMTDDVLEIRLASPRPSFLGALAQPLMGIAMPFGGTGPYRIAKADADYGELWLRPVETEAATEDDGPRPSDRRLLRAERAARAVARFAARASDLVLGGTVADLPYPGLTRLPDDALRFDPVPGLFGLALEPGNPVLDDPHVRDALAMALDRDALVQRMAVPRWQATDRIMPQALNLPHASTAPSWEGLSAQERHDQAAGTITRWRAQHGGAPLDLRIALPDGPGMTRLFLILKAQWGAVGVTLSRAEGTASRADLRLIDEVAPYDSAAWYLSRLSCARGVHCDPKAEDLLRDSVKAETMDARAALLGQAEPLIVAHDGYIPLATPVRWLLVARRLNGVMPSPRGVHGLRGLMK